MSPSGYRLPVLLYHHVGPPRPSTLPSLTVSAKRFRSHLSWLGRHRFQMLGISDVVAWAKEERPLPPRACLITFDDGHADLAEFAFPTIEAAGGRAAVFVVTGHVGASSSWDEASGGGGHRLLDAAAIREWSGKCIDFGAHTRTHRDLRGLDDKELAAETCGSADDLAELTDLPTTAFAYPFGHYDERAVDAVRDCFDVAFTADEGRNEPPMDPHLLNRSMVLPFDRPTDVRLRIALGHSPRVPGRARLFLLRQRFSEAKSSS